MQHRSRTLESTIQGFLTCNMANLYRNLLIQMIWGGSWRRTRWIRRHTLMPTSRTTRTMINKGSSAPKTRTRDSGWLIGLSLQRQANLKVACHLKAGPKALGCIRSQVNNEISRRLSPESLSPKRVVEIVHQTRMFMTNSLQILDLDHSNNEIRLGCSAHCWVTQTWWPATVFLVDKMHLGRTARLRS